MSKPKTLFIRDLAISNPDEKVSVQTTLIVRQCQLGHDRNQKAFLNLVLGDKSGEIDAKLWDGVQAIVGQAVPDTYVAVEGFCQLFQGRRQLVLKRLQILREDDVNPADYESPNTLNPDTMIKRLGEWIATIENPKFRALAQVSMLDDAEVVAKLKIAPAAKTMHHAYRGGMLEHVLSMTASLDFMGRHYAPYVNRDLLILGGFFHDIGKLWELKYEKSTDYTTEGRLLGHLVMGVEWLEKMMNTVEERHSEFKFTTDERLLIKHLVVAHHGRLEYGSPREPQTLEALIVHMVDDLDSKVNAIQKFIAQDPNVGQWTLINRHFERYFYKPEWAQANLPAGQIQ